MSECIEDIEVEREILKDENAKLRKQIEAMKNCLNCEYGVCDGFHEDCCGCNVIHKRYANWQMKGAE
ncbi:hypothetical protein Ga0466249_002252 [Sporomusaceae bacterium BoRhaA]|uniref:hypothetical protein n=1 Tax=Pelorhabdus rhamnosifermentans TaxID=2772457 RepID=UPI001C063BA6|nr:hypothetical protein [Pelorhabdus rhamnosifermentans]MBU2701138.1 hypothetical protein [Pelorhabdus rhamnosifermentans]